MLHKSFRFYSSLAFVVLLLMTTVSAADAKVKRFCTVMSQANAVPPTKDPATGMVGVRVNYVMKSMVATDIDYAVALRHGFHMTQMHFHCAPAGVNGPVVAFMGGRHDGGVNVFDGPWLLGNLDDTSISSTGTGITAPVTCNAPGNPVIATIADFVKQAQAGNIYACAHDRANPGGATRGQLSMNCGQGEHDDNEDDN